MHSKEIAWYTYLTLHLEKSYFPGLFLTSSTLPDRTERTGIKFEDRSSEKQIEVLRNQTFQSNLNEKIIS